jgi:hypothetical protein
MKQLQYLLIVFAVTLSGCISKSNEIIKSYIESKPSFYDLRHNPWSANRWIRKPENLLMIHQTFKKFGYKNIFTKAMLSDDIFMVTELYIKRSGNHLLDSLKLSYNNSNIKEKYYQEFWQRRKTENNDKVVFNILNDISNDLKDQPVTTFVNNPKLVNDTLLNLLKIEFKKGKPINQNAISDFETLRKLGFHQSAYNLLFERYRYQDVKWDKENLLKTLTISKKSAYPWFEDDTP